jgi:hypothetical protein
VNLDEPADNLRAFVKARASLDGTDRVTYFVGTLHSWEPGGSSMPIFGFEGYNVARAVEVDGGYDLLTREVVFYVDPETREPAQHWTNTITGNEVEVLHIWNDPANQQFRLDGPRGPWHVPVSGIGEELFFNVDVFLAYPSPLTRKAFPDNSQDDLYQAAELFQFFCKRADVENEALLDAPTLVSWTRLGPWLPWMKMGDRPGMLVYHGRGAKLDGGYKALPGWLRARVQRLHPEFAKAPREFSAPNETSWTAFKKMMDAKR